MGGGEGGVGGVQETSAERERGGSSTRMGSGRKVSVLHGRIH